jgi:hypothetical protein
MFTKNIFYLRNRNLKHFLILKYYIFRHLFNTFLLTCSILSQIFLLIYHLNNYKGFIHLQILHLFSYYDDFQSSSKVLFHFNMKKSLITYFILRQNDSKNWIEISHFYFFLLKKENDFLNFD